MSTLQHTLQPAFRNRLALVVLLAAAMAALTVTLIISSGNSSSGTLPSVHPSQATIQQQLQAVSGARYGIKPPQAGTSAPKQVSPQQQLQAVAGARYHQPAWLLRQR